MTAASDGPGGAEFVAYIDDPTAWWDDELTDPMEGGPWVDDNPAHRPIPIANGWRCTCARYMAMTLSQMREHADHHPAADQTEEMNR